jgi:hypothetical protein
MAWLHQLITSVEIDRANSSWFRVVESGITAGLGSTATPPLTA